MTCYHTLFSSFPPPRVKKTQSICFFFCHLPTWSWSDQAPGRLAPGRLALGRLARGAQWQGKAVHVLKGCIPDHDEVRRLRADAIAQREDIVPISPGGACSACRRRSS